MKQRPSFPARLPDASSEHGSSARADTRRHDLPQMQAVAKPGTPANKPSARPMVASAEVSVQDFRAVRRDMVNRLARAGIADATVLAAMDDIERHRFVAAARSAGSWKSAPVAVTRRPC